MNDPNPRKYSRPMNVSLDSYNIVVAENKKIKKGLKAIIERMENGTISKGTTIDQLRKLI